MPGCEGLRWCKCGTFYRLQDTLKLGFDAQPDTPRTEHVLAADLPEATRSLNKAIELVARLLYWQHLNDAYRDLYRAHREAEDKASQAKWAAKWREAHPDKCTGLKKLISRVLGMKPDAAPPMSNKPFTVPPYQPSQLQIDNMTRLSDLLLEGGNETYGPDPIEVAELYRELGRFEEARVALQACTEDDIGVTSKLLAKMIDERTTAPVRYCM
jgi:tetratricopeptide (TPR) repeat protein